MLPSRLFLPVLLLAGPALAEDLEAGRILEDARRRYRVENAIQTVEMTLVSRTGKERVRSFELELRRDGEVLRSYARFTAPSDVAGTQLVLVDHPDREDHQLLYLPALERVTRVAGKARSGSFMGSDFRYSDLELDAGDGASHALLREDDQTWVVRTTCGPDAAEHHFDTWVTKSDSLPRRVEWFDADGQLTRHMTVERVELRDGVPVPMESRMDDLKRGTSTRLEITSIDVNVPPERLPDEHFTAAFMERNG